MATEYQPIAFISEEVTVEFDQPPTLTKKPDPPQAFVWRGQRCPVEQILSRWFDFERRGNMARNMREPHLREAARRGSWGVGRYYFRVKLEDGRIFDLYYDRAPEEAADRKGHWYLWRQLTVKDQPDCD